MNSMIKLKLSSLALVFSLILVTGCASLEENLTPEQEEAIGPVPSEWQSMLESYIKPKLRDPESYRLVDYRGPTRTSDGWKVCALITGKNAFGGYAKPAAYAVVIKGNYIGATGGRFAMACGMYAAASTY